MSTLLSPPTKKEINIRHPLPPPVAIALLAFQCVVQITRLRGPLSLSSTTLRARRGQAISSWTLTMTFATRTSPAAHSRLPTPYHPFARGRLMDCTRLTGRQIDQSYLEPPRRSLLGTFRFGPRHQVLMHCRDRHVTDTGAG